MVLGVIEMNRLEKIKNDYNKFVTSEQYGTLLPLGDSPLESIEYLIRVAECAEKFIHHGGPPIPSMPMEAGNAFIDLQKALEGVENENS